MAWRGHLANFPIVVAVGHGEHHIERDAAEKLHRELGEALRGPTPASDLAEAAARIRKILDDQGIDGTAKDERAALMLIEYAEAWAWCVEHGADVQAARSVTCLSVSDRWYEGADLPAAVAAARAALGEKS